MIYNQVKEYRVKLYKDARGNSQVEEYIDNLNRKDKAKVLRYIEFLRENNGYLDEPYSKHIEDSIRELRVDFSKNKHRIFYFVFVGKNIILLHAFLKKTKKTPASEIKKARNNYIDVKNNQDIYGKD